LSTITITEPGLYDMTNEQYHADPVPGGSLSSSGAKKLIAKTPAHFKFDQDHQTHKDVFDFGTAAHSLVLEGDETGIVEVEANDWRTKAAQEAKTKAHAEGKTPLLSKDYQQVKDMAEAIKRHPEAVLLLSDGVAEKSGFWQHDTGVWLRVRFDWLPNARGNGVILVDYKTAVSADPRKFAKSAADFGYHQQDAFYRDGAKALGISEDPGFLFVVQEKTAPYLVNIIELNEEAVNMGRALNEKAIRTYQDCKAADNWPGYPLSDPISLPKYAEWDAEARLEAA
jgi:hypothetical protein